MNDFLKSLETILIALLPLSIFVERTVEVIKTILCASLKRNEIPKAAKVATSVGISIGVCIALDLRVEYGIIVTPLVNEIITGVILSGGSNLIHAMLSAITSVKNRNEYDDQQNVYTMEQIGEHQLLNFEKPVPESIQEGIFYDIDMSKLPEFEKELMRKYWTNN